MSKTKIGLIFVDIEIKINCIMSIVKSFSVGEGDMFYIKHNSDNFTIIDCCLNYEADSKERKMEIIEQIKEASKFKGIKRFISTHPDEDHISGLCDLDDELNLLNFYRVDNSANKDPESEDFKRYKSLRDDDKKSFALKKGCNRKWMNQGNTERGSSGLSCYWPIESNEKFKKVLQLVENGGSPNNLSPIIRYSVEDSGSFLWMGDLESDMQEEAYKNISVTPTTIVFAPHHGRKSGKIPKDFLNALSPRLIVVGEAPSEDLHYYQGYNTITQNSAGDILFDVLDNVIDIFVSNPAYSKREGLFVKEHHNIHEGLFYLGSISIS